jgi:hypothetical protein
MRVVFPAPRKPPRGISIGRDVALASIRKSLLAIISDGPARACRRVFADLKIRAG